MHSRLYVVLMLAMPLIPTPKAMTKTPGHSISHNIRWTDISTCSHHATVESTFACCADFYFDREVSFRGHRVQMLCVSPEGIWQPASETQKSIFALTALQ